MNRFLGTAVTCAMMGAGAGAFACGGEYTIQRGDTLSVIADRLYRDASKWSTIHTENLDVIGQNPNILSVGRTLYLGCIDGLPVGLKKPVRAEAPAPTAAQTAAVEAVQEEVVARQAGTSLLGVPRTKIRIMTGNHIPPFTGNDLERGGLVTEVVETSMGSIMAPSAFETVWEDNWEVNLDAKLASFESDMAYPYAKPDCTAQPELLHCREYRFSQPVFEYLELLFVDAERPVRFTQDSDIEGLTLCRPTGMQNYILDADGRNWVSDGKIELKTPPIATDCFFKVLSGEVDGVVLNEYTAREKLALMGLSDRIVAVSDRPVAVSGLHVMVHREHPQADLLLASVNAGLATLKADGRYREIVSRHLERMWKNF